MEPNYGSQRAANHHISTRGGDELAEAKFVVRIGAVAIEVIALTS